MKTPGTIDGLVFAVLIAAAATLVRLLLGGVISNSALFQLMLLSTTLVYLIYLLRCSGARVGRLVTPVGWCAASLGCWLFDASILLQVLVQAGVIWLVRSLYFHNSLIAAALDGVLVASGIATGAWALVNTGSAVAALWCFFLLQSLFSWIPDFSARQAGTPGRQLQERTRFEAAHRVASDAVRKLTQS